MLKNLKITARLLVSYAILIVLLCIVGFTSLITINRVGASLEGFYNEQFQTVDKAWTARRSVYAARATLYQAMLESDTATTLDCINTAKTEFATIKSALVDVRNTYTGDKALLDEVDKLVAEAEPHLAQIEALATQNKNSEAYQYLNTNYKPLMDKVRENMQTVSTVAGGNALTRVQEGKRLTNCRHCWYWS